MHTHQTMNFFRYEPCQKDLDKYANKYTTQQIKLQRLILIHFNICISANFVPTLNCWFDVLLVYIRSNPGKLGALLVGAKTQQYCRHKAKCTAHHRISEHSKLPWLHKSRHGFNSKPINLSIMRKGPSASSFVMNLWTFLAGWPSFQSKNIPLEPTGALFWSHCPVSLPYSSTEV